MAKTVDGAHGSSAQGEDGAARLCGLELPLAQVNDVYRAMDDQRAINVMLTV